MPAGFMMSPLLAQWLSFEKQEVMSVEDAAAKLLKTSWLGCGLGQEASFVWTVAQAPIKLVWLAQ